MNFLLFLTIVWMQYICSECYDTDKYYPFPSDTRIVCKDKTQCTELKKDSVTYNFLADDVDCEQEEQGGADPTKHCFVFKSACEKTDNPSSEVLVNSSQVPIVCKSNQDCGAAKEGLGIRVAAKSFICEGDICCSDKGPSEETTCPLKEGEQRTESTCEVDRCPSGQHCSTIGCCMNHFCAGGPYLPQFLITSLTKLDFMSCSSDANCDKEKFPDSFCSHIQGGEKKFCCPVPYSKSFIEESNPRYLLPAKILQHHQQVNSPSEIGSTLYKSHNNEHFSKDCQTNSECAEDEFCDFVVVRNTKAREIFNKLKDYQPKMCFPAPRCAGKVVRDKEIGIKKCTNQSECATNEFCDTMTNGGKGVVAAMDSLGVCCQYDCTEEAKATGRVADETMKAYGTFTANSAICNSDGDCGESGLCIPATGSSVTKVRAELEGLLSKPSQNVKLCCKYGAKKDSELYRCRYGEALLDSHNAILKCGDDKDCNKVEGKDIGNASSWKYACVASGSAEKHCCPVAMCGDQVTFMRTELDCKTPDDCMKDEEDKSDAELRAVCDDYFEKEENTNKKKCCAIPDAEKRLAYCTKVKCKNLGDCPGEGMYCHPKKHVCCHLGVKKLDGSGHEKGETCQGTCPDVNKFGTMVPQYCVKDTSAATVGTCFISPYIRVKDKIRTVNPVYKTVCIVCVVLTLVFAFLAVIMFVNYRSRNFCDKYRPKRKGKKGKKSKSKKGKHRKSEGGTTGTGTGTGTSTGTGTEGGTSTGTGGTTGGTSGTSGTGGTTGGDGTSTGDGTSGAGDGTSGASGTSGTGDGTSGTGA